jgi:hypothetical protein
MMNDIFYHYKQLRNTIDQLGKKQNSQNIN